MSSHILSGKVIFMILAGLLFCTGLLSQPSKSQVEPERRFVRVSIPDTAYQHFLSRHDSLSSVAVVYRDNEPYYVFLNFRKADPPKERLHFDWMLAGDRYFFERKFCAIRYFNNKKIDRIPWPGNDETVILSSTTFDGDSVYCYGELALPNVARPSRDLWVGTPARYQGDLDALGAKIAQCLRNAGEVKIVDSALVFEGTVTKQFQLRDLTLVWGEKSVFSNLATDVLLEKGAGTGMEPVRVGWHPATISRGPNEVPSRIFVRLNPDGTVTIETPRKLRTFTRG